MTHNDAPEDYSSIPVEPITDHERLRDASGVPYHEERDVVDAPTVEEFESLPDLAAVGVLDADGEVLFRRLTETCSWKIPVAQIRHRPRRNRRGLGHPTPDGRRPADRFACVRDFQRIDRD